MVPNSPEGTMCKHLLASTKTKAADNDAFLANKHTRRKSGFSGACFYLNTEGRVVTDEVQGAAPTIGEVHTFFSQKGILKSPCCYRPIYCSSNLHHVTLKGFSRVRLNENLQMYSECLVVLISIHLNSPRLRSISRSIIEEVHVAAQRGDTLTLSDVLPNIPGRVDHLIQISVIEMSLVTAVIFVSML